jgi:hypothetical protein
MDVSAKPDFQGRFKDEIINDINKIPTEDSFLRNSFIKADMLYSGS